MADLFEPIAVVGLAARLPGAHDAQEFWDNVRGGRDCITTLTDADLLAAGIPAERIADSAYVKAAGLIPGIDEFDAGYFGMSTREAEMCDPQLRLVLEMTHEAIENAGYSTASIGRDVAVYAACGPSRYTTVNVLPHPKYVAGMDLGMSALNNIDYLATLVSYKFDFRGPSMSVLTACSSALSAAHLACQSLQLGECDVALVAASNVELPYGQGYRWAPGDVRSADGHCRPFDAMASGTIFTNGAGAVVLKRLDDALVAGDHVRGVICGIGINNDGADKVSFSAPSVSGQARAVVDAMTLAGTAPDEVSFVEMHATGTALGDPVEITALAAAYRHLGGDTLASGSIPVGSVKSNIGHTVAAAGLAGLLKLLLALEHDELPATANLGMLNPRLELDKTPFTVPTRPLAWPRTPGKPRVAGLSSLGIGGTNVHLVLREGPARTLTPHRERQRIVVWSGRDTQAEHDFRGRLARHFDTAGDRSFADSVATLQQGRAEHPVRAAVVCRDAGEAATRLADGLAVISGTAADEPPEVSFLFPGVEQAYPRMGVGLYGTQRVFTETMDVCLDAFAAGGVDLYPLFLDGVPGPVEPLLFAVEFALATQLRDWGIHPVELAGVGVGALVAAVVAGELALDDAVRAVPHGDHVPPAHSLPAAAPGRVLVGPGTWHDAVRTMPHDGGEAGSESEEAALLSALATLWTTGVPVDWARIYLDESPLRVPMPGYPFQRRRHWVDLVTPHTIPADQKRASANTGTPFAVPGWVPDDDPGEPEPGAPATCLALVPTEAAAAERSVAALRRAGLRVVQVVAGSALTAAGNEFTVRTAHLEEDLAQVLTVLRDRDELPEVVVHAWATGLEQTGGAGALDQTFFALTDLVRGAARHPVGGRLPAVVVLTEGAVDVTGDEPLYPARAALLGQLRSFAIESSGQRCKLIDSGLTVTAETVADELRRGWAEPVVALRGRRRWVQTTRAHHPRPVAHRIRDGGVYLITGGTGGLGGVVAKALAATGKRPRLGLLTRSVSAAPDSVARLRAELEADGAQVCVLSCDVADEGALDRAIGKLTAHFGQDISAVFHLAGVPGGAMLQAIDKVAARLVFRPKVAGTVALRRCLARRPPVDFVVCFSSQAALTGMLGGADYAAANAFMDAIATTTPGWLAINWPVWTEVGMAASGALDTVADRVRAIGDAPASAELEEDVVVSASDTWAMDEHRIDGVAVLPGTALVDLVIAAFLRVVPGARAPVVLRELVFHRALAGADPKRVRVSFGQVDEHGWQARVRSRPEGGTGPWQLHATCAIAVGEPAEPAVSVDRLRSACVEGAPPRSRDAGAIRFGPRWHSVGRIWESAEATLVELELPAPYATEAEAHAVHPALLDTATGIRNAFGGSDFFVPFLYRLITWHRPLPARLYSYLRVQHRSADSVVLDVDLITPEGAVAVTVEGLTMRRVGTHELTAGRPADGLTPARGVELLFSLLNSRTPGQVAVLPHREGGTVPADGVAPSPGLALRRSEGTPDLADRLREMWCAVLGRTDITPDSDFFDLGGDSLGAVALTARIRDEMGVELGIGTVFDNPTLAQLADVLVGVQV